MTNPPKPQNHAGRAGDSRCHSGHECLSPCLWPQHPALPPPGAFWGGFLPDSVMGALRGGSAGSLLGTNPCLPPTPGPQRPPEAAPRAPQGKPPDPRAPQEQLPEPPWSSLQLPEPPRGSPQTPEPPRSIPQSPPRAAPRAQHPEQNPTLPRPRPPAPRPRPHTLRPRPPRLGHAPLPLPTSAPRRQPRRPSPLCK